VPLKRRAPCGFAEARRPVVRRLQSSPLSSWPEAHYFGDGHPGRYRAVRFNARPSTLCYAAGTAKESGTRAIRRARDCFGEPARLARAVWFDIASHGSVNGNSNRACQIDAENVSDSFRGRIVPLDSKIRRVKHARARFPGIHWKGMTAPTISDYDWPWSGRRCSLRAGLVQPSSLKQRSANP
jgi:hypothetical protein